MTTTTTPIQRTYAVETIARTFAARTVACQCTTPQPNRPRRGTYCLGCDHILAHHVPNFRI